MLCCELRHRPIVLTVFHKMMTVKKGLLFCRRIVMTGDNSLKDPGFPRLADMNGRNSGEPEFYSQPRIGSMSMVPKVNTHHDNMLNRHHIVVDGFSSLMKKWAS